jgi:hypothetical protein
MTIHSCPILLCGIAGIISLYLPVIGIRFSMAPLTLMWLCMFLVIILSLFLLSALGPSQDSITSQLCTTISHFTVSSIYILLLLTVGLYTKLWLMQREAASTGLRFPEAPKVTYWSIIDLQQMKIGVGVLTTLYVAAFGITNVAVYRAYVDNYYYVIIHSHNSLSSTIVCLI